MIRYAVLIAAVFAIVPGRQSDRAPALSGFAQQIASTSETGGFFDTDNLISNESSYLQVIPALARGRVEGGAYIGVGPDQNFTYIARIRPSIAFIVDIRRDNLLLHLLFKALFQLSTTRVDYLTMLFGRPPPGNGPDWPRASIEQIVDYLGRTAPSSVEALRARVDRTILGFGVPLSIDDLRTIDRFHRQFIDGGVGLRFQSSGRPPRRDYPSYRDLLLDRDPAGRQSNVFASEEGFQFVRSLESRDLVIPVVGDLGGPSAMAAVGRLLAERHERLSAFYTSNVEFYLFREGRFERFVQNLGAIPHSGGAVVIRSIFNWYGAGRARPSDDSISRVERVDDLLAEAAAGRIRSYGDLVARP